MKSGFVLIVGRPNAGKSTLINSVLNSKVSITSSHPATTRIKVLGLYNSPEGQIVFLDTPGFERKRNELGHVMHKSIVSSMNEVDIILMLIDSRRWREEDEELLGLVKKFNKKTILAINKVDMAAEKELLLPYIQELTAKHDFVDIVPISALKKKNILPLVKTIFSHLGDGERIFPEDMVTNIPVNYSVAEIIREKIINNTYEEVPQSIAVEVVEMREGRGKKGLLYIKANIIIDRKNLKPIIIGKNGSKLKLVGEQAREDIEKALGRKVFVELWVKVVKNWRERPDVFRQYGYGNF